MSATFLLTFIVGYFFLLFAISFFTARKQASNQHFFSANKNSKWYMIAFGMIGTTMSGVTFISVPGKVSADAFSYYQFVIGNAIGFFVVIYVLLPMYYRLNLTSIYAYIGIRFNQRTQKIASALFLLSRTIGSAARLYLVSIVLQKFIFDAWQIPFAVTVSICLICIWAYTIKGGLHTIIWTDTIQTVLLLFALVLSIFFIVNSFEANFFTLTKTVFQQSYTQVFFTDNFLFNHKHIVKNILGGIFVTIAMVGLDQDIMQKNLSLKNIGEAQKNLLVFVGVFLVVNFLFLFIGALLKMYAEANALPPFLKTDYAYPTIALQYLSVSAGACFMLGLTAATFATTDSALTALTTSFCIDILQFKNGDNEDDNKRKRIWVHTLFCVLIFIVCMCLYGYNNDAIVNTIFIVASYTYAPLLALYVFGMYTTHALKTKYVMLVCICCPVLCYGVVQYLKIHAIYTVGFEVIIFNAAFCLLGLYAIKMKQHPSKPLS